MCFFNDTATTEIYTLSLHDALPIYGPQADGRRERHPLVEGVLEEAGVLLEGGGEQGLARRSEEHTSELQSRQYLVCRLLLEKKKVKACAPTPPASILGTMAFARATS